MQTNEINRECSCCKSAATTDAASVKRWHLSQVTDYKAKSFSALGFPVGGSVTVEGWKLSNLLDFETVVCFSCIEASRKLYEITREKSIILSRRVTSISIILSVIFIIATGILFLLDKKPAFGGYSVTTYTLIIVGTCVLIAWMSYSDAKNYDSNHKNEFDPENTSKHLHEKILIDTAKSYLSSKTNIKKIIKTTPTDFRESLASRPGDVLVHAEEINQLAYYPTGGGWSLLWAKWKTNDSSDTSDYNIDLLKQSMTNQGFKDPGEFLNNNKETTR